MSKIIISGFTFIRNGVELGYPFIESIQSILPIVDEFVIAVGKSSDDTLERIQALNEPKIRIIETIWNEKMGDRGFVYAQQKMIAQYSCLGDWAFYLEGDELLHENELSTIRATIEAHHHDLNVEAFIFNYLHFYGSPEWVSLRPIKECRIIRNTIRSYAPDGLFWVIMDKHKKGRMPNVKLIDASIYHYGYVRRSSYIQHKIAQISKYWESEAVAFDYGDIDIKSLRKFIGIHPLIIENWLSTEAEIKFTANPSYKLTMKERKHRLARKIENIFSIDLRRKHYSLIK